MTEDVRSVDALRLVDNQTMLVHSHLLVLSHLSKLLATLLLAEVLLSKLTKLLVALLLVLSQLTMLRLLVLTCHRHLSRLSELMRLVLWRKLERLHLLLRLERCAVWDTDLVGICVCVGGGRVVLLVLLHLILVGQVVSLVPVSRVSFTRG